MLHHKASIHVIAMCNFRIISKKLRSQVPSDYRYLHGTRVASTIQGEHAGVYGKNREFLTWLGKYFVSSSYPVVKKSTHAAIIVPFRNGA